jgi:hypothetical protein
MQCCLQERQGHAQQRCSQAYQLALAWVAAWQALASLRHHHHHSSSSSSHMVRLLDWQQQQQEVVAFRHPCLVFGSLGLALHRRCLEAVR